jgi:NAD-dependent deacetylase
MQHSDVASDTITVARQLIASSERVLVLTGAGMSTDSGIRDFRGPEGVWTRDPEAERMSTLENYLSSADVRRRSWRSLIASGALEAKPNGAHLALVQLERRTALSLLVTQNTDGLHLDAGTDPARVIEIHGSSRWTRCLACGTTAPTREVVQRVRLGDDDPHCLERRPERPCGGILKRTTILFGESLVPADLRRAEAHAQACDLLLAVGSTLSVYPAAGLAVLAHRAGAPVVIVNGSPTNQDHLATVLVRGPIGEVLPAIVA